MWYKDLKRLKAFEWELGRGLRRLIEWPGRRSKKEGSGDEVEGTGSRRARVGGRTRFKETGYPLGAPPLATPAWCWADVVAGSKAEDLN